MRRRFALSLLLLGLLPLPAVADPRPDILYTTRKEFVQVCPPRPLTLNAHLGKFAYDPLGLEVACAGTEIQADQVSYFVKTLDVRTGKELHRLTLTVPQDTDARLEMMGWTPSGKYLLLERTLPRTDEGGENSITHLERWDLSVDLPKVQTVAEDFPVPEGTPISSISHFASPHGRRVLLVGYYIRDSSLHSAYQVYDAEQDSLRPLPRPDGVIDTLGWTDDTHLLVRSKEDDKQKQMDVVTGQISPLKDQAGEDPSASKQFRDLNLVVDHKTQVDSSRSGAMESRLIWVRCDLRQKQPLSVAGAGMTMGDEDPQAVWSPNGRQIAFLNHGDLYVADVAVVPSEGLAYEKMALGLPLTCPEERKLAEINLKQIGLGIIQYIQDNDEKFPPATNIDETIYPYLKSRSLYSVGAVHWAYHAPDNLSLAAMDAPAETVLGTMDLPCGKIVLYADGHVKAASKEQTP